LKVNFDKIVTLLLKVEIDLKMLTIIYNIV